MKKHQSKGAILFALSFSVLISSAMPCAWAASDGSLDSMWMDQNSSKDSTKSEHVDSAKPAASKSSSLRQTTEDTTTSKDDTAPEIPTSTTTPSTSSTNVSDDTVAPMCTIDAFKSSEIVSKGGWPGVGPFKADSGNDFLDDRNNKLHVDVSGAQITRAELALNNRQLSGNADRDLLEMQMNIDFFLEAVGIKPTKIQELNGDLAKNKELLFRADDTPLNLTAGRCSVSIEKKRSVDGAKVDYLVSVNSLDANKQVLKQHDTGTPTAVLPTPVEPVRVPPKQTKTPISKPVTTTPVPAATISDAALRDQFAALINGWQKIKKGAVRTRQTEELASVLAGKALIRQTDAVKWLTSNKKYYDMSPKGVIVDQYAELAPAKKYMVSAQVHEAYKFIDEPTGKVLKEVDDVNKVNYTVEKIAGKWLITDSALLAPPSKAFKASTTNKSTR